MKSNFKTILQKEASKHDITLTDRHLERFEQYANLLIEWNEKMNLTAITEEYEVIMKHFIDCLEVVKYMKPQTNMIDVGTGAGFPGMVIAIYFDQDIAVTLLDALNKRLLFLEEVVKTLELKTVTIIHGRAEEMGQQIGFREQYDYVVSRAVAGLPTLLEYDSPYLKIKGKCLLLKGDKVEEEVQNAQKALQTLNLTMDAIYPYTYVVQEEKYHRNIVSIKKCNHTPKNYPRNNGQIKKNPLG